ncbi:MAG TPA: helix-turn-helix transcriptional regulator, partial [Pyrinomonadaceae bacterium]|nr:helix-turn-helix transcriptional regulator [Pyrinomonadaceae bacterium]
AFGKEPSSNKTRPSWVNSLEVMIRDMWNEPLSLSDLSTAVGVHPVTISKSFPKYFGCTFGEYVRRLRIERSLNGVLRRGAALTDIALDSGFADHSHFTRTFKQLTGMLPTHLRSF